MQNSSDLGHFEMNYQIFSNAVFKNFYDL